MKVVGILLVVLCFMAGGVDGQDNRKKLVITPLTGDFYIYTTFHDYKGQLFPANSMYLVTEKGVVLLDTPWDSTQFQPLMDSVKARHGKAITLCIATHFHADRTAGLEFYAARGILTYTSRLTDKLSRERGEKRAAFHFSKDTSFTWGQYTFQAHYPGHGHSPDNIVVWFGKQGILYGGCLVKSVENDNLGNIADANLVEWKTTMKNLVSRYPDPLYVIPGHFGWQSNRAVKHTLELLEKHGN